MKIYEYEIPPQIFNKSLAPVKVAIHNFYCISEYLHKGVCSGSLHVQQQHLRDILSNMLEDDRPHLPVHFFGFSREKGESGWYHLGAGHLSKHNVNLDEKDGEYDDQDTSNDDNGDKIDNSDNINMKFTFIMDVILVEIIILIIIIVIIILVIVMMMIMTIIISINT